MQYTPISICGYRMALLIFSFCFLILGTDLTSAQAAVTTITESGQVVNSANPSYTFQKTTTVNGATTTVVASYKYANGETSTVKTSTTTVKNANGSTTTTTAATTTTLVNGKSAVTTAIDTKTVNTNGSATETNTTKNPNGVVSVTKNTSQLNANGTTSTVGTVTGSNGVSYKTNAVYNPKTNSTTTTYTLPNGETKTINSQSVTNGNVTTSTSTGTDFNGKPLAKTTSTVSVITKTTSASTSPTVSTKLTETDARYLLTRVGFAPTQAEINAIMAQPSREAAVDSILNSANTFGFITPQPTYFKLTFQQYQSVLNTVAAQPATIAAAKATMSEETPLQIAHNDERSSFRNWWAFQLAQTKSPLAERMVLFWHNWFPVPDQGEWMFTHTDTTIRTNAMGSYASLLQNMIYDAGLINFLGQQQSTAAYPMANLARELMELFSIGLVNENNVPNYLETDVIEVARALTGLTFSPTAEVGYFEPKMHDNGIKIILGQKGNWGPSDVINILLKQPNLAPRIVSKLWMEFVSPTPDTTVVNQIAASFQKDWQIKPVLRQLFLSDAFWSAQNHGTLVKSPAEYVIGAVRGDLNIVTADSAANQNANNSTGTVSMNDLVSMIWGDGEVWWMPPNVRGFLTGTNWINTSTLLARQQTAGRLANLWKNEILIKQYKTLPMLTPAEYVTWANKVMGAPPILTPPTQNVNIDTAAYRILSDPAYWLK